MLLCLTSEHLTSSTDALRVCPYSRAARMTRTVIQGSGKFTCMVMACSRLPPSMAPVLSRYVTVAVSGVSGVSTFPESLCIAYYHWLGRTPGYASDHEHLSVRCHRPPTSASGPLAPATKTHKTLMVNGRPSDVCQTKRLPAQTRPPRVRAGGSVLEEFSACRHRSHARDVGASGKH